MKFRQNRYKRVKWVDSRFNRPKAFIVHPSMYASLIGKGEYSGELRKGVIVEW